MWGKEPLTIFTSKTIRLNSATWPRNKLIDVLKSLAKVKNLELSNLNVKIEVEEPSIGDWSEEYCHTLLLAYDIVPKREEGGF